MALPALWVGFHEDDFIQRVALAGSLSGYERGPLSLYEFVRGGPENLQLMNDGLIPWFSDPELRIRFFRPLSSLLVALDAEVFGRHAMPAIAHSLLWFAVCCWLVTRIHRQLLPERAAFWASLVFVVAGSHAASLAWIAARHVLVGGAFALAAWLVQLRTRERDSKLGWAGVALLGTGLLASEAALAVLPFVLFPIALRPVPLRARLRAALPWLLVPLLYLGFYVGAGYGPARMGSYVNPLETPLRFALDLGSRLPQLMAETFSGVPAILGTFGGPTRSALIIVGYLAFGFIAWMFLQRRRELGAEQLPWLPVAFVASMVPVAGTILDGRVLLIPMAGSSMMIGALIALALDNRLPKSQRRRGERLGLVVLLLLNFALSPLARLGIVLATAQISRLEAAMPERARIRCASGARVLLVGGSDPAVGLYAASIFRFSDRAPWRSFHVLTMAPNDLTLHRDGPNSFVMRIVGPRETNFAEQLYRSQPLPRGARVTLAALSVQVLEAVEEGPTAARFELANETVDEVCFLRWQGGPDGYLESFSLPDRGVLELPHVPGPMGR